MLLSAEVTTNSAIRESIVCGGVVTLVPLETRDVQVVLGNGACMGVVCCMHHVTKPLWLHGSEYGGACSGDSAVRALL